jgi:transcriptional regulator with XRE-family HTH domain
VSADQGPLVERALLRQQLIKMRHAANLTQQEVADALEWHSLKLIRIEGGKSNVTRPDLEALPSRYAVAEPDR